MYEWYDLSVVYEWLLFGMGVNVCRRVWKRVWKREKSLYQVSVQLTGIWSLNLMVLILTCKWWAGDWHILLPSKVSLLNHVLCQHWLIYRQRNTLSQLRTNQAFIEFWPFSSNTNLGLNRPVTFNSNACALTHWIPFKLNAYASITTTVVQRKISKPQYRAYWPLLLISELSLNRSSKYQFKPQYFLQFEYPKISYQSKTDR